MSFLIGLFFGWLAFSPLTTPVEECRNAHWEEAGRKVGELVKTGEGRYVYMASTTFSVVCDDARLEGK